MSKSTRHTIHRDHIHQGWNNAFPPALKIAPGETVHFETLDASSGKLTRTSTAADLEKLDFDRVNPVTGPVYIDGAKPGDALKVSVLSFRPSGWDWTGNIPGFGLLSDQFPQARLHHWNYDPGLAPAMYGPGGRIPLRPFTGTIGVAPASPGLHSIIPPRNVGGNMDARDIAEGAELYLPVEVEGAIFSVGDTHAAQGDGEVCGTAIESPIDVTLRFDLVKGANARSPRYVTPGPVTRHFDTKGYEVTTGIGPDLMAGARMAVSERAVEPTFRLCARRCVHAVQRLRGSADQLNRGRAELGRLVLLPARGLGIANRACTFAGSSAGAFDSCNCSTLAPVATDWPPVRTARTWLLWLRLALVEGCLHPAIRATNAAS